jgi:DNA modification methylase
MTPSGSNTTGFAAQKLGRRWLAFEKDREYLAASALRFMESAIEDDLAKRWQELVQNGEVIEVESSQARFLETPVSRKKK